MLAESGASGGVRSSSVWPALERLSEEATRWIIKSVSSIDSTQRPNAQQRPSFGIGSVPNIEFELCPQTTGIHSRLLSDKSQDSIDFFPATAAVVATQWQRSGMRTAVRTATGGEVVSPAGSLNSLVECQGAVAAWTLIW